MVILHLNVIIYIILKATPYLGWSDTQILLTIKIKMQRYETSIFFIIMPTLYYL